MKSRNTDVFGDVGIKKNAYDYQIGKKYRKKLLLIDKCEKKVKILDDKFFVLKFEDEEHNIYNFSTSDNLFPNVWDMGDKFKITFIIKDILNRHTLDVDILRYKEIEKEIVVEKEKDEKIDSNF